MKKFVIAAALTSGLVIVASAASAQTSPPVSFYGTLGYSAFDRGDYADLGALTARGGVRLNPYVGLELEGGLGVKSDKGQIGTDPYKTQLSHTVGAYAVGFLPITPQFDLFVRAGYGDSRVRSAIAGTAVSASSDSWNYGVGGQYMFDARNGVRADFTRHDFGDSAPRANVVGVSYIRKF